MSKIENNKQLFYCWFGNKDLPNYVNNNIETWKKNIKGFKIYEINESNFDVNINKFTKLAYENKKYAFVSDYARFYYLYNYGGLYFDTDVEIIKSLNPILKEGPFFACQFDPANKDVTGLPYDLEISINPGSGSYCKKGNPIIKSILDYYDSLKPKSFNDEAFQTVDVVATKILMNNGLKNIKGIQNIGGFKVYPSEYFSPKSLFTEKIEITNNTYAIHHFKASWKSFSQRSISKLVSINKRIFGISSLSKFNKKK